MDPILALAALLQQLFGLARDLVRDVSIAAEQAKFADAQVIHKGKGIA